MNKNILITCYLLVAVLLSYSQNVAVSLNNQWQFRQSGKEKWYTASVPGTVHTDLVANKLIPDPYFRDNETRLQWIDTVNWDYQKFFNVDAVTFSKKNIHIVFDGLDTYADVYLNGILLIQADNMFRQYSTDVKSVLKKNNNRLCIHFASAQKKVDSIAKASLPLTRPDNHRVYARKAQYHFGWDWGPKFVGCGIWKSIRLETCDVPADPAIFHKVNNVELIQQPDSIGTSFYFRINGKPVFMKGANYIPSDVFLPRIKKNEYRKILQSAKDANMNMLRVWGGGVYEADEFYDLCDSMGIMIWQDFMFAGGMYPGDERFMKNVKEEVKYQVQRLRHHSCIVLWCGNNEIDEAWHNWGWQEQFNLHGSDSANVWRDYTRLFEDSLRKWVNELDGTRPYVASSPKNGWGHKESFTEGDSHYWGLWWGLEPWEIFANKTGRFVSEYGMQSLPDMKTIESFTGDSDRYLFSPVIRSHQKANDGFNKLNFYLNKYFIDTAKLFHRSLLLLKKPVFVFKSKKAEVSQAPNLEDYIYLTQCLQYYILKNSIAVHRSKEPNTMGTLLWQLNDCWPVASWSITDYSRQPKAAWYAVKEAYRDDTRPVKDSVYPKDLHLQKPTFRMEVSENEIIISSTAFAKYVFISCNNKKVHFSDNYFDLQPGEIKKITYTGLYLLTRSNIKVRSLFDVLNK